MAAISSAWPPTSSTRRWPASVGSSPPSCNAVISFIESGGKGTHLSLVSTGIHPGVVVGKKGLKSASELKGKVVGT